MDNKNLKIGYENEYHNEVYGWLQKGNNFEIKSKLLRDIMFPMIGGQDTVLEYGAGSGVNLAALQTPNKAAYDFSQHSRTACKKLDLKVYDQAGDIPKNAHDFVISSHCLEHVPSPHDDLLKFKSYLKPTGKLILILPVERQQNDIDVSAMDVHQHLFSWTFRTAANLLIDCGYDVQSISYKTTGFWAYNKIKPRSEGLYQLITNLDNLIRPLHKRHLHIIASIR